SESYREQVRGHKRKHESPRNEHSRKHPRREDTRSSPCQRSTGRASNLRHYSAGSLVTGAHAKLTRFQSNSDTPVSLTGRDYIHHDKDRDSAGLREDTEPHPSRSDEEYQQSGQHLDLDTRIARLLSKAEEGVTAAAAAAATAVSTSLSANSPSSMPSTLVNRVVAGGGGGTGSQHVSPRHRASSRPLSPTALPPPPPPPLPISQRVILTHRPPGHTTGIAPTPHGAAGFQGHPVGLSFHAPLHGLLPSQLPLSPPQSTASHFTARSDTPTSPPHRPVSLDPLLHLSGLGPWLPGVRQASGGSVNSCLESRSVSQTSRTPASGHPILPCHTDILQPPTMPLIHSHLAPPSSPPPPASPPLQAKLPTLLLCPAPASGLRCNLQGSTRPSQALADSSISRVPFDSPGSSTHSPGTAQLPPQEKFSVAGVLLETGSDCQPHSADLDDSATHAIPKVSTQQQQKSLKEVDGGDLYSLLGV
ncbi:unnamed protein product, partial [Protopolystoma xenopodis]